VPRPDAVLLTCTMTYWYPGVQAVVELVRRRFGAVPVILGGIYATLCPEHARAQSGADVVVSGPGERAVFAALRDALGDGVPPWPDLSGFDALPAPAFGRLRDRTWLPVLTSRGCPFRCTFCASHLLANGFEQRAPASVAAEIENHHALFGTRHFAFYDDALLLDKDRHALPLLERIAAAATPVRLHAPNGLHIREIDSPVARLFRAAGLFSLYLSLESADASLVRERTPKASPDDLPRALAALEAAGYERRDVGVYLIMGLPGQSGASVEESIRFVRGLGATPRVAFFSPIPGTAEWDTLARTGVVTEETDPLLQNKIAFAYLKGDLAPAEFERISRIPAPG
ncbi:MAG: B12-binding domain-containing radical SAM protein, partial [Candidatus Aminicenantales bacterium]